MPHQKKAETVVLIKTITTIRPYFFESDPTQTYASARASEGYSRYSVDLGHLYWNREFDAAHLHRLLKSDAENACTENGLTNKLDLQAVSEVDRAKAVLGSFSREMPSAAELMFSFRVLSRCAMVASRHEKGLEPHVTRGLIATEYNQYNLAEILKAAKVPETTAVGRCLIDLLSLVDLPKSPAASVINLRNDGELNQAVLLAAILKRRWPDVPVILDTSGANEQFNFNEWVPLLVGAAPEIGRYIDYFLPRQDYGATQRALLALLAADVEPDVDLSANVVHLSDAKPYSVRTTLVVPPIEEAFSEYIRSLPVFYTAGQRTIVGRLSPAKCHWAACKFCTINSQHIMPRGLSIFDSSYQHHFETLVNKIDKDRVESVILMDEALHPNVLIEFAHALLSKGISISYRARCRFTNDLSAEACRLIYDSGCRYLGLGLEAASPRVNRLVHKHTGPPIDYDQILLNLERAGIRMHIYAILGFPTETKAEIEATRNFLIRSIRRFRYLTVSANLFHLMRGSGMAQQPSDFNIESVSDQGDVGLVLDFVGTRQEPRLRRLSRSASLSGGIPPRY